MSGNLMKTVGFLGSMMVLAATACVSADERAATSSLPAALAPIGVSVEDVVSSSDAHQVRGQGGINHGNVDWLKCYWGKASPGCCPPPPPCNYDGGNGGHHGGNGYTLTQTKSFSIADGTASGTVNMMEGFVGTIAYKQVSDGQTLVVVGTFGGLAGTISASDKGLQFQFAGKALQETFDFTGTYNQHFSQSYMFGK
jgi:hypothetical protein